MLRHTIIKLPVEDVLRAETAAVLSILERSLRRAHWVTIYFFLFFLPQAITSNATHSSAQLQGKRSRLSPKMSLEIRVEDVFYADIKLYEISRAERSL